MIIGALYLFVKLLVLAALYFGIEWLVGGYPQPVGKIWAAILCLLGAIFVFQWLGVV